MTKTPYQRSLDRLKSVEKRIPKHLHEGFVPVVPARVGKAPTLTNPEVQDWLDSAGLRVIRADEMTPAEMLSNRFDHFASDVKQSFEILAGKVLPLLGEIRDIVKAHSVELREHEARLALLEQTRTLHADVIGKHDQKHGEHAISITGVLKRLVIVEEAITVRKPKRKAKK